MSRELQRVVIVDDHQLLIDGLVSLLQDEADLEVVATYTDPHRALDQVPVLDPDVLVVDVDMPGMSGGQLLQQLGSVMTEMRSMVITMHLDVRMAQELLGQGVLGYLLKNDDADDFAHAVRTVSRGKRYISPRLTELMQFGTPEAEPVGSTGLSQISPREREILILVAQGATSKEIADQLHLSPRTVETHRKALLEKLDVRNVVGLVRIAIQEGLI